MIIFKYEKTAQSALSAHVDTLRAVTALFRRAGLNVAYSNGYNPHMELCFSPPLALGVESLAEYVAAKAAEEKDILERINSVCPSGIRFCGYAASEKDLNPAAAVNRAEYLIYADGVGSLSEKILEDGFCISYRGKDGEVTKDVSSRIFFSDRVSDGCLKAVLAAGGENLRPDRLAAYLAALTGADDYRVVKTRAFCGDIDADEYFGIAAARKT